MKKILLFLLLLITTVTLNNLNGQSWYYDYMDASDWSFYPNPNSHIAVGNGLCTITNLPGAPTDIRISQPLNGMLGDYWKLTFLWRVESVTGTDGGAVLPVVCTAGNLPPSNPDQQPTVQTIQDAIGVLCVTTFKTQEPIYIKPYVKDEGVPQSSECSITINAGVTYRITLEKYDNRKGRLTVASSAIPDGVNYNYIVGTCCFDIPETVTGLTYIQTANLVQASDHRCISAFLSKTAIETEINTCCDLHITGPSMVCNSSPSVFCLEPADPNSYPLTWNFPGGVIVAQTQGNCVVVTDWGNNTGLYTFSVTWTCNCIEKSASKTVLITSNTGLERYKAFNYTASTSGNYITPITATATNWPFPAGVVNQWDIFDAANDIAGDLTYIEPAIRLPSGTGSTWTWLTPETNCTVCTPIMRGEYYILRHRIYYQNAPDCTIDSCRKLMLNKDGGTYKLSDVKSTRLLTQPRLYPNPAQNSLTIELPLTDRPVSTVHIYNTLGTEVRTIEGITPDNTLRVSLEGLAPGLYLVKFEGGTTYNNLSFIKE